MKRLVSGAATSIVIFGLALGRTVAEEQKGAPSGKHWQSLSQWSQGTSTIDSGKRFLMWPEGDSILIARKDNSSLTDKTTVKVDLALHWRLQKGENSPRSVNGDEMFSLMFVWMAGQGATEKSITTRSSVPIELPRGATNGVIKASVNLGRVTGEGTLMVVVKKERQGKGGVMTADSVAEVMGNLPPETMSNLIMLKVSVAK